MKKNCVFMLSFLCIVAVASASWAVSYKGELLLGNGLVTGEDNSGQELGWITGTFLRWEVNNEASPGNWLYTYTFGSPDESPTLSHAILEVSSNPSNKFTLDNIKSPQTVSPEGFTRNFAIEVATYSANGSNPGLLGTVYGMTWDFKLEKEDKDTLFIWSFLSDREPMWGDFYAMGGRNYAFNTGFGSDTDDPIGNGNAMDNGNAWVLVRVYK
jgi:hypothetical protein